MAMSLTQSTIMSYTDRLSIQDVTLTESTSISSHNASHKNYYPLRTVSIVPHTSFSLTADDEDDTDEDFVFKVSPSAFIARVCAGVLNGTYYVDPQTQKDAILHQLTDYVLDGYGKIMLDEAWMMYYSGRCNKQTTVIFILAWFATLKGDNYLNLRKQAWEYFSRLRTHSQAFSFLNAVKTINGKIPTGRMPQHYMRALLVGSKECPKDPKHQAYQIMKYSSRAGWSMRDVLRLSHFKADKYALSYQVLARYVAIAGKETITNGAEAALALAHTQDDMKASSIAQYINDAVCARKLTESDDSIVQLVELIRKHYFTREFMPTWALNSLPVLSALVGHTVDDTFVVTSPMTALLRNLGSYTSHGVYGNDGDASVRTVAVAKHLRNAEMLISSHIHPFSILLAQHHYEQGPWDALSTLTNTLNIAFEASFPVAKPYNKRTWFAMDTSGSMSTTCVSQIPTMYSLDFASFVLYVLLKREHMNDSHTNHRVYSFDGYSHTNLSSDDIYMQEWHDKRISLGRVSIDIESLGPRDIVKQWATQGATDCSLPLLEAEKEYHQAISEGLGDEWISDVCPELFVIFTDNDTWRGDEKPFNVLQRLRAKTGLPIRMVVVATRVPTHSIANPRDPLSMDVFGADGSVCQLISDFASGRLDESSSTDMLSVDDAISADMSSH